jgi:putative transposase
LLPKNGSVKAVAGTLGVSRSNLIERLKGNQSRVGHTKRSGIAELLPAIRRLVDQRPTYGYPRIAARLNREGRAADETCRQRQTGASHHGQPRPGAGKAHGRSQGPPPRRQVMVNRSNLRWCSDDLEFNSSPSSSTRPTGDHCLEGSSQRRHFRLRRARQDAGGSRKAAAATRTPHAIEHLSDNGSAYTARETRLFAKALKLTPCFTPVEIRRRTECPRHS